MNQTFRLSRITSPRATLWSVVLLVLAFCAFGLSANAAISEDPSFTSELPHVPAVVAERPVG